MSLNPLQLKLSLAQAKSKEVNDGLTYHGLCIVDRTAWASSVQIGKDAEPTTIFIQTQQKNPSSKYGRWAPCFGCYDCGKTKMTLQDFIGHCCIQNQSDIDPSPLQDLYPLSPEEKQDHSQCTFALPTKTHPVLVPRVTIAFQEQQLTIHEKADNDTQKHSIVFPSSINDKTGHKDSTSMPDDSSKHDSIPPNPTRKNTTYKPTRISDNEYAYYFAPNNQIPFPRTFNNETNKNPTHKNTNSPPETSVAYDNVIRAFSIPPIARRKEPDYQPMAYSNEQNVHGHVLQPIKKNHDRPILSPTRLMAPMSPTF